MDKLDLSRKELLFDKDYPPIGPIDEEFVRQVKEFNAKYRYRFGGDWRITMGYIYTDEDIERMRKKADKLP